ncbi:hypothetical protein [Microcella humidisoli]|uniref:Uncharacterized protein n=1 Tax=Microcella humidisoli TaxID=2963406 RepID=A0ABY5FX66_9MICO|nr:hypothetical protein [Microcella humidisoli]UTT62904.1 hypothetical protein NNL39_01985 [Microcella humidisoli]
MKIMRRIAAQSSPQVARELGELGIQVSPDGHFGFWFDESDSRWPAVVDWLASHGRSFEDLISTTRFTNGELKAAEWHEFSTDWHWSYPQPNDDVFGYRKVTYDDSEFCPHCGIGLRQVAPFRMRGEPRWGRRSVLQLNWVFDELFVTPELWDSVFKPLGVPAREVHNSRGEALTTVVQLVVDDLVDLEMGAYPPRRCGVCGIEKFDPVSRGFFPAPRTKPTAAMCRSNQWFGSGARAFRAIMASREVYAQLQEAMAKGAVFVPVRG